LGRRNEAVCLQLKALLKPFGITRYYTDSWSAYTRHLAAEEHEPGKRTTQHIERKHLTLRTRTTRLVRQTIGFSRSPQMHDLVIGLFVIAMRVGCRCATVQVPICHMTSLREGRDERSNSAQADRPFRGSIPLPDAETVFRTSAASAALT
jgi:IS1 family transposase